MRTLLLTVPGSDGLRLAAGAAGIVRAHTVTAAADRGADPIHAENTIDLARSERVIDLSTPLAADAMTLAFADLAVRLSSSPRTPILVRIPGLGQPASAAVLDRAVALGVDGILLPGSLSGHDATLLDARISVAEAVHGTAEGATRIIAEATDSARAIFGLASYRGASHRLAGLVFNAATLARDLGGISHRDTAGGWRPPLAQARGQLLLAAAAAGVAAIEMVAADDSLDDAEARARADGFAALLVDARRT